MKSQKKLTFLTFSAYRIVLFCGLFGIVLFAHFFGPMMWRYYVGTGNAFNYQSGTLAVHYLDVGQGDAIIIQLPDGRTIMMDSGLDLYYTRVKTYLTTRILTDKKIDIVIATHTHDDHIGGFPQLLVDFDVDMVYRPHNKSNSDFDIATLAGEALGPLQPAAAYTDFITAAYTHANQVSFIEAGVKIEGSDEQSESSYQMYFHTPTVDFIERLGSAFSDFNNISPIISLRNQNRLFIFTGDAGFVTEDAFRDCAQARSIDFKNLDVYLKIGHHGSEGSTSHGFLELVNPNKAVISVGERNLFNHPRPIVFDRLEIAGVCSEDILETRHAGNIALVTDSATDRLFLAFDNEIDLSLVYVVVVTFLFFVCFTNLKKNN